MFQGECMKKTAPVLEYLNTHITYMDGPMGTYLQSKGLPAGTRPEVWNLTNPEAVIEMHRSYFDVGSNIVCTNTFGANRLHFPDNLEAVVEAAVSHVRTARERSGCTQPTFIALKMSSLGKLLKPFGDYDFEEAVERFAEVVRLGVKYGVDLVDIETMNDSYETKAALLAVKENSDLPVFVSNTFTESGRLMTGATPEAMVALLEGMRADAIGINCSLGPEKMAPLIERYLACASIPVFFRPNAGLPKIVGGRTVYGADPDEWAETVAEMVRKGVRMAGGCCGTDARFTRSLIEKTRSLPIVPVEDKGISWVSSYTHTVEFGRIPILNAERINPNATEAMKTAVRTGDVNRIQKEALREEAEGAQLIDVNVGLPEINEPEFLQKVTVAIQAVSDVPLVIDTSDPEAMEAAIRHYNGKAVIDTVSGKEENMKQIFPIAQKYGGMIVALCLDEGGIPKKAEDRVAIAKKILARAEEYGISKKEFLFEPLALTISTDTEAALETLKTTRMLHEMGCLTSIGISNISFGLPARHLLNSAFFIMALDNGLSTGIVNTGSQELLDAYYAYCVLKGLDPNCRQYLEYCSRRKELQSADAPGTPDDAVLSGAASDAAAASEIAEAAGSVQADASQEGIAADDPLAGVKKEFCQAIIDGLEEEAVDLAEELLKTEEPLSLISSLVIPALDEVGKQYETQEIFLPELLESADAAQSACVAIREHMTASGEEQHVKCPVVLATVKGDVHDIGKNIVKILLENYGFEVHDLGTDVAPEIITEHVIGLKAPLCGLSALMTTTVPAMEETIKMLSEKAPWCKVVVGGAVINQEFADQIGAHHYAPDAMDTVRYADRVWQETKG